MRAITRGGHDASWHIAVEAPVEIVLNGTPWTVLLATPADLDDLAIGVALTEGVLRDVAGVEHIEVAEFLHEVQVRLTVSEPSLDRDAIRSRSLASSTACGLCGIESLAQLQGRARPARAALLSGAAVAPVADAALQAAFAALAQYQPINRDTRSVHAAAWCTPQGEIVLAREDVGRHNALDKLVGAMARHEWLSADGFIIMTSRCSYELVYKAALTGARALATISAPTSMALEWSRALALPLVCCSAGQPIVRFPHAGVDA
jgi:FdhD protein